MKKLIVLVCIVLFFLNISFGEAQSFDDMLLIPAGEFLMGDHHDRNSDALPVHNVILDSFYMGK